ncbi:unnamed protein product [Cylicocyclus nassatus]|uniref:Uncharacterized protein n=1 Tax=Cylicocyclus nassatus TaxID=53992 RepID=A0AA36DK75_CYLNA|nr:unnamed protein product [Cylicocyclus nassatus]
MFSDNHLLLLSRTVLRASTNNHEVRLNIGAVEFLRYLRITLDPEMRDGFHNDSLFSYLWHATRKLRFDVTNIQPVKKDEETKETKQELQNRTKNGLRP